MFRLLVKSWLFFICREGRVEFLLSLLYEVFIIYTNRQICFDCTRKCADCTLPAQTQQFVHVYCITHAEYIAYFLLFQTHYLTHIPIKLSLFFSCTRSWFCSPTCQIVSCLSSRSCTTALIYTSLPQVFGFLALFVSFVRLL